MHQLPMPYCCNMLVCIYLCAWGDKCLHPIFCCVVHQLDVKQVQKYALNISRTYKGDAVLCLEVGTNAL